jgi:hypothetical protein
MALWYSSLDMSLVQVIYTRWSGGVSIWGGSNHTFGPEPRLNEALLRSFGKVKLKRTWHFQQSNHTVIRKHIHFPLTTVKLGLDGCLLLQLLSVMRYIHHRPRHVRRPFNDTH